MDPSSQHSILTNDVSFPHTKSRNKPSQLSHCVQDDRSECLSTPPSLSEEIVGSCLHKQAVQYNLSEESTCTEEYTGIDIQRNNSITNYYNKKSQQQQTTVLVNSLVSTCPTVRSFEETICYNQRIHSSGTQVAFKDRVLHFNNPVILMTIDERSIERIDLYKYKHR